MKFNSLFFCTLLLGIISLKTWSQTYDKAEQPKLVVGVIVDQMRYDYLSRFWEDYSEGGFKRLIGEGFECKNAHYNYAPTYTGPGHASVYAGTSPATHGIISNGWYDKESKSSVYCVFDETMESVGTSTTAGKMSPHRMLTTSITDQLRLHSKKRSKVIAISLKDRGAVLPGGHMANAAYWFQGLDEGNWISSSFYMDALPKWVQKFNEKKSVSKYKKDWTLLKDISNYTESVVDENNFEGKFVGETSTSFPHRLPQLWEANRGFDILKASPYGNSLLTDFALEALEKEKLGKGNETDFLAISFSSTDYIGHQFGVDSKEIQDTYMRLDLDISRLLAALDKQVGAGNYTLFLTADHAAVQVPSYLKSEKIPAGYVDQEGIIARVNAFVSENYGEGLIDNVSNNQIFLNLSKIEEMSYDLRSVQEAIAHELMKEPDVDQAFTAHMMWANSYDNGIPYILQNGYNQKRSGDVLFVYKPSFISYSTYGSQHGSPEIYDTHIPLLFYGKGFKTGYSYKRHEIVDIAPTLAALLGIAEPNGTTGVPIEEVLK
jgi:predicted AlkP superfamily pyrophosphatase or phosphodiesterase